MVYHTDPWARCSFLFSGDAKWSMLLTWVLSLSSPQQWTRDVLPADDAF